MANRQKSNSIPANPDNTIKPNDPQWPGDRKTPGQIKTPERGNKGVEEKTVIPLVRTGVPPTPQYAWPLLKALTGVEVVVGAEGGLPRGGSLS